MKVTILLALFFGLGLLYCFPPKSAKPSPALFVVNSEMKGVLPRNFRITPLHTSASSQFSEDGLERMLEVIPSDNIILVDLREEPHGFLNGIAVSWYGENNWVNKGKSDEEIGKDEEKRLKKISHQLFAIAYKDHKTSRTPTPYLVREVASEEDLARKHGIGYFRLYARDHTRPNDKLVDAFIAKVKSLKGDEWLHFHCSAGKARSTTFLAMYDMMKNGSDTLDAIISRQHFYGGINLFNDPEEDKWKYTLMLERVEFIKRFYQYCQENPEFLVSWSEWVQKKESFS